MPCIGVGSCASAKNNDSCCYPGPMQPTYPLAVYPSDRATLGFIAAVVRYAAPTPPPPLRAPTLNGYLFGGGEWSFPGFAMDSEEAKLSIDAAAATGANSLEFTPMWYFNAQSEPAFLGTLPCKSHTVFVYIQLYTSRYDVSYRERIAASDSTSMYPIGCESASLFAPAHPLSLPTVLPWANGRRMTCSAAAPASRERGRTGAGLSCAPAPTRSCTVPSGIRSRLASPQSSRRCSTPTTTAFIRCGRETAPPTHGGARSARRSARTAPPAHSRTSGSPTTGRFCCITLTWPTSGTSASLSSPMSCTWSTTAGTRTEQATARWVTLALPSAFGSGLNPARMLKTHRLHFPMTHQTL